MERVKENKFIIILLVFLAICIFLIENSYLPAPDEYNYSHIAWTDHKISGINDLITSQISLYQNWTGRIPVHTTIQTILWLGTWIYNIINPIIFIIFIILLGSIIKKEINYFKISLTLFLILFTIKAGGEKFIWLSGSINYLWTTTIMLGVMYYFYKILMKDKKLSNKEIPIFLILSFLAGWSQENVAFVLGTFIIMICLINIKKFLKYPKRDKAIIISSIIIFGIGALALIFAPGNFLRASTMQSDIKASIHHILSNLKNMGRLGIIYVISLIIIWILRNKQEQQDRKDMLKLHVILIVTFIVALIPMILINEFPPRSTLPYEAILLIGILANSSVIIENLNLKKSLIIIEIILTIGICYRLSNNIFTAQKYMVPYKEKITSEINQAKEEGKKDLVLSAFEESNKVQLLGPRSWLIDFSPTEDKDNIINQYMARFYGFDSIIINKAEESDQNK